jgi:Glycosyltransferase family 25 (LPS biosynthesis protein)
MERQNRPPPLTIPLRSPAFLSSLAYNQAPSAYMAPSWNSGRRRNRRRMCGPLNNMARVMFIALLVLTGTLTWLLVRDNKLSSPLSQLPTPPIHSPDSTAKSSQSSLVQSNSEDCRIANSTLNFQQIFAINLPSRSDRRDLLTVMATYSNLSITIMPGVRSVAENALPPPREPDSLRPEEYAVWRSHANIWRKIIEDDVNTALILEDDNDWDLNLKEQIPRIMDALTEIRAIERSDDGDAVVRGDPEIEPWDLLYLGTCYEIHTLSDKKGRRTVVSIPSDQENVATHNYNWVIHRCCTL